MEQRVEAVERLFDLVQSLNAGDGGAIQTHLSHANLEAMIDMNDTVQEQASEISRHWIRDNALQQDLARELEASLESQVRGHRSEGGPMPS